MPKTHESIEERALSLLVKDVAAIKKDAKEIEGIKNKLDQVIEFLTQLAEQVEGRNGELEGLAPTVSPSKSLLLTHAEVEAKFLLMENIFEDIFVKHPFMKDISYVYFILFLFI
jgi:hypothetical protein